MANDVLTSSELYATDEFKAVAKLLKIDNVENIKSININMPPDNDVVTVIVSYFVTN